jgi:uncharacterized membrane protein YkvA (DUF1232 family)
LDKVANKDKSIPSQIKDAGFFRELWQQIRLVFYLIKDSEVPLYLKILPLAGILYTLFPIDIIADVVPVLGQLDDLTILLIGAKVFIEMSPPHVVARYMAQMRGEPEVTIIEGSAAAPPEPKLIEGEIVDDSVSLKTAETEKKRGFFRR